MKQNLFKTLLVAVGLCVGASAWAAVGDETVNANIDFTNAITDGAIAGTVNSISIGSNTEKGTEGSGNLIIGNGTSTVTIPSAEYAGTRDKVTVTFDIAFGKLSGKEVFFNAKDKDGTAIFNVSYNVYSNTFSANTLDISGDDWYHGYNTVIWGRSASLTIEIDYAAKTISTSVKNNYSNGVANHTTGLSNTNPVATFNVGSNYNNDARRCQFDNLVIKTTEGDYTVSTADYKVKYVCGGEEVKSEDTRNGDVGSPIALLSSDKATFDAGGKRYIYESDDLGTKTVEGDGSTVVTITFREAAKYGYTITSSYNGNPLPFTQSVQYVYEDDNTVTIQCPKYYDADGTLVVAPLGSNGEPRQEFTITADNFVGDIEYTSTSITNLYLLSEGEDLTGTGLSVSTTTGANDRVSCAKLSYGNDTHTLLTLPAGKYIFTLGAWGGAGNAWSYVVKAGETEIINSSCAQNTLKLEASEEFTLTAPTAITITNTNSNTNRGIDLIYVQKTGDATEITGTIPASGFASLASNYGLDFSSATNLTGAYVVSNITASAVELTSVNEIPANSGVILTGNAGDAYSIPVKADAEFAGTNLLKAAVTATVISDDEAYILKNGEFCLVTGTADEAARTIPAGKAYLLASDVPSSSPAPSLMFVFADDIQTTGVQDVRSKMADVRGDIFDLQGRKVANPTKGLYIMNGKKVMVK